MESESAGHTSAGLLACLRQEPVDQEAWTLFVRRYGRQIYHWCRRWRLQEADAQDVTQNVLVKLAVKLRTFDYDPSRSFRAYLKALTNYAWRDLLASRKRPGAGSGDSQVREALEAVPARDDPARRLDEEGERAALEAAFGRVRRRVEPHTWDAFRLTALEGLSGAAAAERLRMKVATVFKARSKVQKMLKENIEEK
jgi:RNA polymerase sigma-70 factor (ECF subfamily)